MISTFVLSLQKLPSNTFLFEWYIWGGAISLPDVAPFTSGLISGLRREDILPTGSGVCQNTRPCTLYPAIKYIYRVLIEVLSTAG